MTSVEIYTTRTCPSCIRAKRLFRNKGVAYEEIDVSMDRSAMIERTDGRMTVPQIFIGDRGIGGFDELLALDRTGELDGLLGATWLAEPGRSLSAGGCGVREAAPRGTDGSAPCARCPR